jgi:hypothetical protein
MLSRRPNADKGEEDNQDLTLLPPDLFIRLTMEPSEEWMELERRIERTQRGFLSLILTWRGKHHLQLRPSTTVPNLKLWHAQR